MIDRLVRDGLASRQLSTTDRRIKLISLTQAGLALYAKVHWVEMRGMVTPYSQGIHSYLQLLGNNARHFFDPSGLHLNSLDAALMAKLISQQAMIQAYISAFWLIAASFIAMLPLLLLIKSVKPAKIDPAHAGME